MIQAANIALWQLIGFLKSGPAIGSIHEFVGKTKFYIGKFLKVRDLLNPKAVRKMPGHPQGVRIIETEWFAHPDTALPKGFGQLSGGYDGLTGEDFLNYRPRILRIRINFSAKQRIP